MQEGRKLGSAPTKSVNERACAFKGLVITAHLLSQISSRHGLRLEALPVPRDAAGAARC